MNLIGRTAELKGYLSEETRYRFAETAVALSRLGGLIECAGSDLSDAL